MTTAKMQAVVTAITNAGYDAEITKVADNNWIVYARSSGIDIPITSAKALADAQTVTGLASSIQFQ